MVVYDKLSSLNDSRNDWRVIIRVSRIWFTLSANGIIDGCNLILLDAEVHAFANAKLWHRLKYKIREGEIYDFSNFIISDAIGILRPVRAKIFVTLTPFTIIRKVLDDNLIIPMRKFDFCNISDLYDILRTYSENQSPHYSIDVIGVVQDIESTKTIPSAHGDRFLVSFKLTDGSFSAKVNLWDEHVAAINKIKHRRITSDNPVVVILASSRLYRFTDVVELATMPSTRIYIDDDDEHILMFKHRLNHQ